MLTMATTAVIVTAAAMPWAVVSDAVVAGIFSLTNTILTAIVMKVATSNARKVDHVKAIVDRREEDTPPPDGQLKRETDPV